MTDPMMKVTDYKLAGPFKTRIWIHSADGPSVELRDGRSERMLDLNEAKALGQALLDEVKRAEELWNDPDREIKEILGVTEEVDLGLKFWQSDIVPAGSIWLIDSQAFMKTLKDDVFKEEMRQRLSELIEPTRTRRLTRDD